MNKENTNITTPDNNVNDKLSESSTKQLPKTDQKNFIKPTEKISATTIYSDLKNIFSFFPNIVKPMQKDIKMTYGYTILNTNTELIRLFVEAYEDENIEQKIQKIKLFYSKYKYFTILLKFLFDSKELSNKQYTTIITLVGGLSDKILNWLNSTMNKEH